MQGGAYIGASSGLPAAKDCDQTYSGWSDGGPSSLQVTTAADRNGVFHSADGLIGLQVRVGLAMMERACKPMAQAIHKDTLASDSKPQLLAEMRHGQHGVACCLQSLE